MSKILTLTNTLIAALATIGFSTSYAGVTPTSTTLTLKVTSSDSGFNENGTLEQSHNMTYTPNDFGYSAEFTAPPDNVGVSGSVTTDSTCQQGVFKTSLNVTIKTLKNPYPSLVVFYSGLVPVLPIPDSCVDNNEGVGEGGSISCDGSSTLPAEMSFTPDYEGYKSPSSNANFFDNKCPLLVG